MYGTFSMDIFGSPPVGGERGMETIRTIDEPTTVGPQGSNPTRRSANGINDDMIAAANGAVTH